MPDTAGGRQQAVTWMEPAVWHLGQLHPAESALVLLLAFGPFLALAVVAVIRARKEQPRPHSTGGSEPENQSGD
ncbi:MAG: hypothetical protein ABWX57_10275 [Aeromicrobium sp.]